MRRLLLFLFSHRTLALIRWDLHFLGIRLRNGLLMKRRGLRQFMAAADRPLYLNLGSGPKGLKDRHWINVDGYSDTNVQYLMDFSREWPFPNSSLDGIFCEHVFEHFDMERGLALLRESLRVLQPGCCLRIIVPDGEKILQRYFDSPAELREHRPGQTSCAMEAVNSYFRQRYDHQWIYDWELLEHQLQLAGFDQIARVSFGKGELSQPVLLDDHSYSWESLYVEAVKPDPSISPLVERASRRT